MLQVRPVSAKVRPAVVVICTYGPAGVAARSTWYSVAPGTAAQTRLTWPVPAAVAVTRAGAAGGVQPEPGPVIAAVQIDSWPLPRRSVQEGKNRLA